MGYRFSLLNGDDEDQQLRLTLGGDTPDVPPVPLQDQPPEPAPPLAVERAPVPLQDAPTPAPALNVPAAAAQPAQQGLTGQEQLQALLQSQLAKRDPELEQLYAAREKQALRDSAAPKYGGAELARDVLGTVPAYVLDALVNHGRGAAGIALTGAQAIQANRAEAEAKAKAEADLAVRMHGTGKQVDPLMQALAIQRLGVQQQQADQTGARVTNTIDWRNQQANPNSPYWTAKATGTAGVTDATVRARQNALHDLNAQMTGDASNIAGGQENARIDARLQNAPATAAAAASQAAGVETAKVGAERAAQAANRPLPAGYYETDAALRANANEDPATRGKMMADTMTGRQLAEAAEGIAALRAKNGPQWVPSPDSGEYQALHLAVVGAANRVIADAGTLNQGERELMTRLVPGVEPNWKDFAGWIAGADLNAQQLEGFAKGLRTVINSRVASYGLGYGQPPQGNAPGLGVVGGRSRSSVPAQGLPQHGGGGLHHALDDKGKRVETQFTPEQIQAAIDNGTLKGWQVVD